MCGGVWQRGEKWRWIRSAEPGPRTALRGRLPASTRSRSIQASGRSWAELTCLPWPSHTRSGRSRRSTTTWENGAPSPSEQTSCTAREYTRWLVSSVEQLILEEKNIAIALRKWITWGPVELLDQDWTNHDNSLALFGEVRQTNILIDIQTHTLTHTHTHTLNLETPTVQSTVIACPWLMGGIVRLMWQCVLPDESRLRTGGRSQSDSSSLYRSSMRRWRSLIALSNNSRRRWR